MARKQSTPTKLVLQALLDTPSEETYGFELTEATGLASGTVYPILHKLEADGVITHRWDIAEVGGQRRRRRYYRLTADGQRVARAATAEERQGLRLLAPGWGS